MNHKKYGAIILIFLAGSLAGVGLHVFYSSKKSYRYSYLAKRVQIDNPNTVKINFTTLRTELINYINSLGDMSEKVSLYYEYLPTGVSININEKNEVVAASLMKLPVIMNLYKAAELGKIDLDQKVSIKKEWLNDEYGELYKKGEGYEITFREAASLTLKNSDNTALLTIWDYLEKSGLENNNQSLNYLDVEYQVQKDQTVQIGARSYSSILKCLYLSCFNDMNSSNEILMQLSRSTFNNRLTKYLPTNLLVAHKIGAYSEKFQSDCGIFYVPRENYILCVMVEGPDLEASRVIADISQKTYLFNNSIIGKE